MYNLRAEAAFVIRSLLILYNSSLKACLRLLSTHRAFNKATILLDKYCMHTCVAIKLALLCRKKTNKKKC